MIISEVGACRAAPRYDWTPSPSREATRTVGSLASRGWVPSIIHPGARCGAQPVSITLRFVRRPRQAMFGRRTPGSTAYCPLRNAKCRNGQAGRGSCQVRIGRLLPTSGPTQSRLSWRGEKSAGSTTSGPRSRPPTSIASTLSPPRSPRTTPSAAIPCRRCRPVSTPSIRRPLRATAGGTSAVVTTSVARRPQPSVARRISRRPRRR